MDLYPAIDIRAGSCVRLYRGDYDQETIYSSSPADQAEIFVREGAKWIHVVDLDAARSGQATNTESIAELVKRVNEVSERHRVRVQVGGGVRSVQDAHRLFDLGVDRVVIGTAAIQNPDLVTELAQQHSVAVGLDAWGSDVAIQGWQERTGKDLYETLAIFEQAGIEAYIVTEIERDGTLQGPDIQGLKRVLESTSVPVIASGGVGTLEDLEALAGLKTKREQPNKKPRTAALSGAIVGRAIYEKRFSCAEAVDTIKAHRTIRVIPCLDVDGGRVVKGVNFVDLRDAGDPVELANRYDQDGADEIVFLDITATSEGRETTIEMAGRAAKDLSVAFTVGGGIRSVEDVEKLLDVGVDKVSIASAAVARPQLINEIADRFGSDVLVVAIDAKANPNFASGYEVYIKGGTTPTGIDCVDWAIEVSSRGAGEILLTSMDTDGTEQGFDNKLNRCVTDAVDIGVVASGGVGTLDHLVEGVTVGGVDAVLAASIFHFGTHSVSEAKAHLAKANIVVNE